ncbi:MAG: flagellar motor protein MotB [Lachnospiraceae bacterium]|nr:flagellar motor protein MotB [Lachnospiraceae bacterium]
MARKKKKQSEGGGAGAADWMQTFSDLMNLLLCFFVLLFSMSTVDAQKFEEVAASLKASYSIFDGGAASLSEGSLISSGISQLNDLDDYYENMGTNQDESEETDVEDMEEFEEIRQEEMIEESEQIGEELQGDLEMNGLLSEGSIDIEITAQYVMLNLSGTALFDSSSADIKDESYEFLNKLGNVLKKYDDYQIEIVGHTDSRPMASGAKYKNNMLLSQARAYTIFEYLVNDKDMDAKTMKCTGRGEYEPIATNTTAEGRAQNRRVEIRIYNSYSTTTAD